MRKLYEVHNCYALYELGDDGEPAHQPIVEFRRPQDWANPKRWNYVYCKIEIDKWISHAHIWQEVCRNPVEACKILGEALFIIFIPGRTRELCDRSHLADEDFWLDEWGRKPPVYIPTEVEIEKSSLTDLEENND